ncbi:hypothetical protein M1563_00695 [Patescibacteria group bacterium]|nr:hypothetical protein [Patescibacteria group bacterium]MCL5410134.1 hypothetical protein [Patescibacteria group bacterium]
MAEFEQQLQGTAVLINELARVHTVETAKFLHPRNWRDYSDLKLPNGFLPLESVSNDVKVATELTERIRRFGSVHNPYLDQYIPFIWERYGIETGEPKTLKQIAQSHNISVRAAWEATDRTVWTIFVETKDKIIVSLLPFLLQDQVQALLARSMIDTSRVVTATLLTAIDKDYIRELYYPGVISSINIINKYLLG